MRVLKSMMNAFSHRVLDEYRGSKGYLKINERQKFCSVEVLKYLLSHGVDEVRRREIRGEFIGEREDWKRLAIRLDGKLVRPAFPLSDSELQHILNKLILAGYVTREETCPDSKRTKDRKKMDVYYRVSLSHLIDEDWLEGKSLNTYREIMSSARVDRTVTTSKELMMKKSLARSKLSNMGMNDISDKDLDTWLNNVAVSP